jgi:hypothetical protein
MMVYFTLNWSDAKRTYSVTIADGQGNAQAAATANMRSEIHDGCGLTFGVNVAFPLISASSGRVYFLDGDTNVRFLAPDGSTGFAHKVPGNSRSASMFSVSPDDKTIAVAVYDYTPTPQQLPSEGQPTTRMYVENLADSAAHIDVSGLAEPYSWPLGWHSGNLIVGSSRHPVPGVGFYSALPEFIDRITIVDPTTGHVRSTFGDPACFPESSLPTPVGMACVAEDRSRVGMVDWTGKTTIFAAGDFYSGGASLSTDGTYVLTAGHGAILQLLKSPTAGGAEQDLGNGVPGDGGWIDSTHIVLRGIGTDRFSIIDLQSRAVTPLPAFAVLMARLPGGL